MVLASVNCNSQYVAILHIQLSSVPFHPGLNSE